MGKILMRLTRRVRRKTNLSQELAPVRKGSPGPIRMTKRAVTMRTDLDNGEGVIR
jgi:hypothetical protein